MIVLNRTSEVLGLIMLMIMTNGKYSKIGFGHYCVIMLTSSLDISNLQSGALGALMASSLGRVRLASKIFSQRQYSALK